MIIKKLHQNDEVMKSKEALQSQEYFPVITHPMFCLDGSIAVMGIYHKFRHYDKSYSGNLNSDGTITIIYSGRSLEQARNANGLREICENLGLQHNERINFSELRHLRKASLDPFTSEDEQLFDKLEAKSA